MLDFNVRWVGSKAAVIRTCVYDKELKISPSMLFLSPYEVKIISLTMETQEATWSPTLGYDASIFYAECVNAPKAIDDQWLCRLGQGIQSWKEERLMVEFDVPTGNRLVEMAPFDKPKLHLVGPGVGQEQGKDKK